MPVNANHVFLVSGQRLTDVAGENATLSPEIMQCVVVANDATAAYKILESMESDFRPLGLATLADYESTASTLRAVLSGEAKSGWKLIAPESVLG